jgi:hypothetical protein
MIQSRVVLHILVHNEAQSLIFAQRVIIHDGIIPSYGFLVLTATASEERTLSPVGRLLVDGIQHISASGTELHSFLVLVV